MSTAIHLMQGLPASGKSTYVRGNFTNDELVLSRDNIRKMFGATGKTVLDASDEKKVTEVQMGLVRDAITRGVDVVIDDTNLNANFTRAYYKLGVNVYPHVMDTDVETCVARNAARKDGVPEAAIRRMASRPRVELHRQVFAPYVPDQNKSLPIAWVFDIDGTLADSRGVRGVYDNTRVHLDRLISPVARVLQAVSAQFGSYDDRIVFMSGRDAICRDETRDWLEHWDLFASSDSLLLMRAEGDRRDDAVVKSELFDQVSQHYNVLGVFDDRARVVNMWRTKGLRVFHVDYGQF